MKELYEKAVEGGYSYNCGKGMFTKGDGMECYFSGVNSDYAVWTRKDNDSSICVSHEETLLEPEFWKCAGVALGWGKEQQCYYYGEDDEEKECGGVYYYPYQYEQHRLLDHIQGDGMEGIDGYLKDLVVKK